MRMLLFMVNLQAEMVIKKLEKNLAVIKSNEEIDKHSLKPADDAHQRHSGSSPVKDSKVIKQLWDEIAKKDSRLQDLEKYV